MTELLPEPLVPPEVDLRGYGFMPLYGHHLFGSEFNARCNDAEWRAGVTLWWAAWNQVPAASLPDDDVALCRLADLGRDLKAWRKIRANALHGFVKCSDGRLYHKFLAQHAIEAWDRRVKERERKAKWRASRERDRQLDRDGNVPPMSPSPDTGQPPGRNGRQGQGEGQRQGTNSSVPDGTAALDLKATVFGSCLGVLAAKTGKPAESLRSLVGKWCRDYGEAATIEAFAAMQREGPIDPIPWLERCLARRANNRAPPQRLPASRRAMN